MSIDMKSAYASSGKPFFFDAITHLYKRSCPSGRPSVCPVFFFLTTENVISRNPMTTKFHVDQEKVENDIKMLKI